MSTNRGRRWRVIAMVAVAAAVFGWFRVTPAAAYVYKPPWADIFGNEWEGTGDSAAARNFYTSLSSHYSKYFTLNTDVWTAMSTYWAQSDAIWADFGHGGPGFITWCDHSRSGGCTTVLRTNFDCTLPDGTCLSKYPTQIHRIRLMVFAGCRTAQGTNMAKYAYNSNGVDSSIAFYNDIKHGGLLPAGEMWAQQFPRYLNQHYTVGQAASLAAQDVANYRWPFGADGWDSQRVYGSGVYTEPAAYGS